MTRRRHDRGRASARSAPTASAPSSSATRSDGSVGLARLLATVVDDVEIVERDGREWVRLVKQVEEPAEARQG